MGERDNELLVCPQKGDRQSENDGVSLPGGPVTGRELAEGGPALRRFKLRMAVIGVVALTIAGGGVAHAEEASSTDAVVTATTSDAEPGGENVYDLIVNGEAKVLDEGETVTFDLLPAPPATAPGAVSPRVIYPGNGGSISVTASNGVYRWKVLASCATGFDGNFAITDLSSGFSGGFAPAFGLSGAVPTSKLKGHRYSGTLSGVAFNGLIPCAWTGPNNTLYQY